MGKAKTNKPKVSEASSDTKVVFNTEKYNRIKKSFKTGEIISFLTCIILFCLIFLGLYEYMVLLLAGSMLFYFSGLACQVSISSMDKFYKFQHKFNIWTIGQLRYREEDDMYATDWCFDFYYSNENIAQDNIKTDNIKENNIPKKIKEYITQIHDANDKIPNPKLSKKIESIEKITEAICENIEKKPELAPSIQKFTSYYLPTTVKLLDAYAAVDKLDFISDAGEPLKQRIEESIDKILTGFKSLYDNIVQLSSMELMAEIDVMIQSLSIDGLLDDLIKLPEV